MIKYKDLEVYAFSGKIGVGKNYILENIFMPMLQPKQTVVLGFADHFKVDVVAKDKIPYAEAFHKKTTDSRKKMQFRGTEDGREVYGENIWVDAIDVWVQTHYERGVRRIIITDVRFLNELEYIKNMGGTIIRVNAPDRNSNKILEESNGDLEVMNRMSTHRSEIELDNYTNFDYIINNTIGNTNLYNDVRDIVFDINKNAIKDIVIFCDLDDTICHCHSYYDEVLERCISKAKEFIKPIYHTDFEYAFTEILGFLERNMQYHYIYKERYADSMVNSFMKFKHMFIDDIPTDASDILHDIGMSVFNYDYKPLDNAVEYIKQLNDKYKVVFVTIGTREEQVKKLSQLGLSRFDFEIFDHKDEFVFRNLTFKYKANKYISIGDSLPREIEASLKLNFDMVVHIDKNLKTNLIEMSDNYYKVSHISNIDLIKNNLLAL